MKALPFLFIILISCSASAWTVSGAFGGVGWFSDSYRTSFDGFDTNIRISPINGYQLIGELDQLRAKVDTTSPDYSSLINQYISFYYLGLGFLRNFGGDKDYHWQGGLHLGWVGTGAWGKMETGGFGLGYTVETFKSTVGARWDFRMQWERIPTNTAPTAWQVDFLASYQIFLGI